MTYLEASLARDVLDQQLVLLRERASNAHEAQHVPGEPIRARELSEAIREKFSVNVHPRTIERALAGKKTPR